MSISDDPELSPRAALDAAVEQRRLRANGPDPVFPGFDPDPLPDPDPPPSPGPPPDLEPPPPPLKYRLGSSLADCETPPRPWLIDGWIPRRQVTLLTGDGKTGKTILALQLMVAAVTGTPWLGRPVMQCLAFGLLAEDDDEEIERRLRAICAGHGIELSDLGGLAWRSAVVDFCELVEVDYKGGIQPTLYFEQLRAAILASRARLVVLDAATNLFGGDEIRRRQVNGFLALLRKLAIEIDGAVILLAHPSNQGLATGSGLSGSNHWGNAVRSQLNLRMLKEAADADADADIDDERTLTCQRLNYGRSGEVLRLRWRDGAFVALDAPVGIDRAAANAKADRVFLALLKSTYEASAWVSASLTARNYAPTVFSRHPDREGLGRDAFERAMARVLNAGQIELEEYGKPSDRRKRLVRC